MIASLPRAARLLSLALVSTLLATAVSTSRTAFAGPETKAKKKVHAADLVRDADRATSALAAAARATPVSKDAKNRMEEPFFTALKRFDGNLEATGAAIEAKDKSFVAKLSKGTEFLATVEAAAKASGIAADAKAADAMKTLANAWKALRHEYGKEAIRRKQGGALTEAEKADIAKAKASQSDFVARLRPLKEKSAASKGAKRYAGEIDHLLALSAEIGKADQTVDALIHTLWLLDVMQGEWAAFEYYVDPGLRAEWIVVDTALHTTFQSWDTWTAEVEDAIVVEEWTSLEAEAEVPADLDLDVEITDEEFAAEDAYLDTVEDTTVEEFYEETASDEAFEDEADDDAGDLGGDDDDGDGD
jgi:hypothetical protein